jgi:cation diffusion facilitator CzcD-associated flavoprotein CzcO
MNPAGTKPIDHHDFLYETKDRSQSANEVGNALKRMTTSPKTGPVSMTEPFLKKEQRGVNPYSTHYCAVGKDPVGPVINANGIKKVGIIGAGVSGVVTARIFIDEGVDVTVFETSDLIGGVWSQNYAGFGIQVPSALYEFPDEAVPDDGTWDFCAGKMVNNYINMYAQKHGVTDVVSLQTYVEKIEPKGQGYTVTYKKDGRTATADFDLVIIATGPYGKEDKFIPPWKGLEKFKGKVQHCADYMSLDISEGKDVVTVGYGKSAFDCAQISVKVAKSSTILFREAHWAVPRKILNLVPFEYATFSRFGAACLLPAYPVQGPFEKLLHAIPKFLSLFWSLVEVIFSWQLGMRGPTMPEKGFIEDFWGGHGILPNPNFYPMVNRGDITALKDEIAEVKETSLILKSGKEIPCGTLIAATGYKPIRPFLPQALKDAKEKDGLWLYRNMIHPEHPRMVFLNCETTTFTNITTASIQARWLVELLAGRHSLPSKAEMQKSIEATQAWKRRTMPNAGPARAYMVQTHQVHYYDQLLKDMGASVRRKRGNFYSKAVKEIFDPYRPRDFDTIITGDFKNIVGEQAEPGDPQTAFYKEAIGAVIFFYILYYVILIFVNGCYIVF